MDARLRRVRILVLDVDGVLTDGSVWVATDGTELKRFSIRDGLGLKLLMRAGIRIAVISGHGSEATLRRLRDLGVEDVVIGVLDKRPVLEELLARHHLDGGEAAAMGDDLLDLPMLRAVGFAATVPGAPEIVRDAAHHVTGRPGGHGAVREVAEMILTAQGRWHDVVAGLGDATPPRPAEGGGSATG